MFNGFHDPQPPRDAELATQALAEEAGYRFGAFSANDAVTLGLSLRKRFRASSRHAKGKGLAVAVHSAAGHPLFACTVGDLGGPAGVADVSLDSWACLEGMIEVVKRTGHSSYYVEKGMAAMGKTPEQMGVKANHLCGGAFPIWLEACVTSDGVLQGLTQYTQNAPCCPIAVVACYSGSSVDDHHLVVTTVRDYLKKMARNDEPEMVHQPAPSEIPSIRSTRSPPRERGSMQWVPVPEPAASSVLRDSGEYISEYRDSYHDEH
ncbi:hypothetical protein PsYK624_010140 [Phanerochaete sordida]|uniref:Uncharacterized protein n=1 Tax=Phanerochaete sordida TaxID=48140 RepID=A0A9P3FYJ0_9APHY|nr:hypothetical protein PsYK624_010140 [Phanerochaete sordida]